MRKRLMLLLPALLAAATCSAQLVGRGYMNVRVEVIGQDSVQVIDMLPLYVFNRPVDMRRYDRLVRNLKVVYPIAKHANRLLLQAESQMAELKTDKQRRQYIKQLEDYLKKEYTPILKQMTFSQGKLLLKLIDRETSHTSYELVKELRGSFSAFLWQGVARLFGANLKESYDKAGEDRVIEQLILYYEAGML